MVVSGGIKCLSVRIMLVVMILSSVQEYSTGDHQLRPAKRQWAADPPESICITNSIRLSTTINNNQEGFYPNFNEAKNISSSTSASLWLDPGEGELFFGLHSIRYKIKHCSELEWYWLSLIVWPLCNPSSAIINMPDTGFETFLWRIWIIGREELWSCGERTQQNCESHSCFIVF